MKLQALISTMHQKKDDFSLLEKMNIHSDAIIINQCERNDFDVFNYNGREIKFFSFSERGVGLSRNNALLRASHEISLFGDDDVRYVGDYEKSILNAFKENPKADVIIFNLLSRNPKRSGLKIEKSYRVRWYNALKFGMARVAIRTEKIRKKNIHFSLLFGGGAKYSCGEDSIFLTDCLKNGLKIYTNTAIIGYVDQKESTWFTGYNEKFFYDKGALFATISPRFGYLLSMQFVFRKYKTFKIDKKRREILKWVLKGTKGIR